MENITPEILEEEIIKEIGKSEETIENYFVYSDVGEDSKNSINNKKTPEEGLNNLGGDFADGLIKRIELLKMYERIKNKYELYKNHFPNRKFSKINESDLCSIIRGYESEMKMELDYFMGALKITLSATSYEYKK